MAHADAHVDLMLLAAVELGDEDAAREAIELGARSRALDSQGRDAFLLAAAAGRADLLALLLPVSDPKAKKQPFGESALSLAALAGAADCVALLVPLSDTRSANIVGATALMHAASGGHADCVELLLPMSNPDAQDKICGENALTHAIKCGRRGALGCFALLAPVSTLNCSPEFADWRSATRNSPLRMAVALAFERLAPTADRGHDALGDTLAMIRSLILLGARHDDAHSSGLSVRQLAHSRGSANIVAIAFEEAVAQRERQLLREEADWAARNANAAESSFADSDADGSARLGSGAGPCAATGSGPGPAAPGKTPPRL
jgi:ankyrin repeat protein